MIKEILTSRNIMEVWDKKSTDWETRRNAIIELLLKEEYGYRPPKPDNVCFKIEKEDNTFCAGKALLRKVRITGQIYERSFEFPFYTIVPTKEGKHPFFVHINFRDCIPDKYLPIEEIIDDGFAVLMFCYKDVTDDNDDFTDGVAAAVFNGKERAGSDCGKIAIWSWAASVVMDYAQTLDCLDMENAAVVGHSRLGKTALLTGMMDKRFKFVISNDSGCSGAAISRGKEGEKIKDICSVFSYWFCPKYINYVNNEEHLPFDQHFLLASIAPRKVYISSAKEDTWADPASEYLSCCAASEVYEKLGIKGFIHPDTLPVCGDVFADGNIGYHIRNGKHYLSREDWKYFMRFIKQNI